VAYYGSKSHPQFGFSTADNVWNFRATVFNGMPEHGHAYSMGIRAGYFDPSDPGTVRLALYGTSSGHPASRKSSTNSIGLNTRMADASGGQDYTADLLAAVLLSSGAKYALAALFHGGRMAHGQNNATDTMFNRDTSLTTPPDPMGYTYSDIQTQIAIWVNYQPNSAPNIPSSPSPADGASFTTTTPTYEADFRDVDETLPNGLASDFLNAYQIQVRSVSAANATTGTVVWDSGWLGASGTEKTNRRFSRVHGGSALTPGQRYQWRSRVQDRFGAQSGWTSWTGGDFLVSGAAIVTLDGNPTGRTTDTTPDFQGKYHQVSGTASSHVQVRLFIGESLIATSPEIAKVVASAALPGTGFTITAAESTFGTLADDVRYSYQVRAKASGVWSDWSAARDFKTNGRPTIPVNLRPVSGSATTSYPMLMCQTSDPDGDTLTTTAYLTQDDGTPIASLAMTFDAALYAGTGGYKKQLTGSHLTIYGTYRATFDASDGDMTSARSAEIVFVYAQGPTVTVDGPTEDEVITTDTPTFSWTTTDQQKRRIRIYRVDDDLLIHDSGLQVSGDDLYEVPANVLRNETDYYATVEITDSNPLTGISDARHFRLEYTAPSAVTGFIASPDMAAMDVVPSVVRLTWDEPILIDGDFLYSRITRRVSGEPVENEEFMVDLPSISQTDWVDPFAPPATDLIYRMVYVVAESFYDQVTSGPAESTVRLDLPGSVLSDVRDGLSTRVVFDSVDDRTETPIADQTEINTWDGGPPWLFEGPTEYTEISLSARLTANDAATVEQQLTQLRALARFRADRSSAVSCYRDERGRRLFGRVRDVKITDQRLLRANVEFRLTEIEYSDVLEAAG